jgi:2-oxoisovalerate dehydrogenase E2 component (dihydrolipoyl transacylase)
MAQILMPQLGESVTEGTIAKWLKQVGDSVQKYEPIAEVITDKVNAEVPSDFEGILTEILVEEGTTVAVGTPIAQIEEAGKQPVHADESVKEHTEKGESAKALATTEGVTRVKDQTSRVDVARSRFSPAVMHLLQEHGIDPSEITGTGLGGRITRKDVLAYLENRKITGNAHLTKTEEDLSSVAAPTKPATGPLQIDETVQPSATVSAQPQTHLTQTITGRSLREDETEIPVTPIRRTIAKRMIESKHQAPHAWTMVEVDVTNMVRFRDQVKEEFKKKEGFSLTYLPLFIKAVVESLKEYPILNSEWAEDKIILKKQIHISIAVASDDALFVPVIHHADRLSVSGLAHAIHDLATRARAGKLTPSDMSGGTFTVNNTGAFGSILSQPIINSPQAAILTMEAIVKKPVIMPDDSIAIRHMMNMCLSLDHRVLDGLVCGKFLAAVKKRLENMSADSIHLY